MSRPAARAKARHRLPAGVRRARALAVAALGVAELVVGTLAVTLATLALASSAFAWWSATGSGTGTADTGTLSPPTGVLTSSAGADVTVTWTGAAPPESTLTGYTVSRWEGVTRHDACGTDPALSATFVPDGTLTCTDTGVPDGDHTYTVTAVFRTWTAQSGASAPVTVEAPQQSLALAPGATNASLTGTALYYRSGVAGGFALRSTVTSVQAGPASATFPAVTAAGWTHAAETVTSGSGGPSSIEYASSGYAWDPAPDAPATHVVTGRDTAGGRVETLLTLTPDDVGPTGGALTVNGTAGAAVPTIGYAAADYAIDVRTDYTDDAGSGVVASVLTVQNASLAGNVCGTFGAPVEVTGTPTQVGTSPSCYLYVLTGTDAVGNTSSVSTVVRYDVAPPTQAVTLVDPVNAAQTGNTLYFRTADGSFTLSSELTDAETAPASVDFPTIATAGWTHGAESVTDGTGATPTKHFASATYTFTASASTPPAHDVLGRDLAGNVATTSLTFTRDSTAPTGGALTVNGGVATTGGSSSFSATGDFTIGARTDYTDAGSGIDTSILTLATASLSGGVCGTYGTPIVLVGTPDQLDLTTGCYLYTLTGLDRVGNIAFRSHAVKVDVEPTTGGALSVNGVDADDSPSGTVSYSRTNPVLIDLRDDWDDAESGIASSTLTRTYGTLSNGTCAAFANATTVTGTAPQTLTTTRCYRYVLTGTDSAGNSASVATVVYFDTVIPVTGALTVNGVAASTAGTTSLNKTGSFSIGSRVEYTDAGSGIASSVLTLATAPLSANTCGTYGSTTVLPGAPAQSGLTTGCYRYTLTGTDRAGNVQTTTHTVKVDTDPATGGAVTVNGTAADDSPGGTLSYSRINPVLINARTDWTDAESGLASSTLTSAFGTLANGTCAAYGSTSTITGTTSQTLTTTRCYRYVLTGTDNAGNASAVTTVVRYDTVVPVTGALTVNGVAASGVGTTSFNKTGSFTIGARTDWTDAGSGLASSVLTVATAPLSANACGTYGSTTELAGTPAQSGLTTGCHRYTLTGTDLAGNVASTTHTVKVDLEPATGGAVSVNGTGASPAGTTSGPTNAASIPIDSRTDYTDAASGIASSTLIRALGSFAGGACGAFSGSTTITGTTAQTGLATNCYRYTLTGTDNATNTAAISTIVRVDYTLPVTGALTVNSVAASSAGTSSFNKTGSFTIGTRTDYTDAASGIGSSVLTVASAPLSANTCGSYGSATVLAGSPAQSGLGNGCYRFVLTGTDLAGNVASTTHTVKVDRDVPTGGAVTVNSTAAAAVSTTSGPTNAASFPVGSRTDYVDAASGLASSLLIRAVGTYTAGACGTFSGSTTIVGTTTQSGLATSCYRYTLTGTDNATNTAAVSTIVRVDVTPPTTGALTVNGVAASAVGTSSFNTTGAYSIGTRTEYTDAASGIGSSVLTLASAPLSANTCGAYGTAAVVVGKPAQSGLTTGCYRYVLTGTDLAGNVASATHTVKVDREAPTGGAVTVNGTAAAAVSTTSGPTNAASFPVDSRTDYVDAESGLASSLLIRAVGTYTAGACGTFSGSTTIVGTTAESGLATSCYRYTLTGTDNAANTAAVSTIVRVDVTPPTTGALTVNGTAASAAGTVSTGNSDSFTIGTRTANTDAASGLASSTLTREFATLTGSTCAAFSGSVTITGTPDQTGLAAGCYRYTLTGVDNAGNVSQISTTVHIEVQDNIRVVPAVARLGGETLVNTTTDGSQDSNNVVMQAVASDADGNYVVAWHGPGTGRDIYAQRFSADGTALGVELMVNTYKDNAQAMPNVAMDAAGNFVIAWRSQGQDDFDTDPSHGIYAQRYNTAGEPAGEEFRVNSTTAGLQDQPAIAMASDGSFAIAWSSDDGSSTGVFAQRYNAAGNPQGNEFRVNTFTSGAQNLPSVGMDAAGNFVITWTSASAQDGSGTGIFGQRYDAGGTARGIEFLVNSTTEGSQSYADVAMLADGRFVVAWQTEGSSAIYLQRYGPGGSRLGSETRVNDTMASSVSLPSVSADASGNIVVVWTYAADGDGSGVFGQRLDWSGATLGGEFLVNTTTAGNQGPGEVVAQPGGRFVVAWIGNGAGDPDGVFMQRYGMSTTESGGTASFQVVLEVAPTADVVVPVSVPDATEGTVSVASLTFTSTNWNIAQTVIVTGVQDGISDGDQVYEVVLGAASSADSNFNALDPADLSVTNLEVPNPAP